LVSLLDEQGQPAIVQRAWILPPRSQIGPITESQRHQLIAQSIVAGVYEKVVDRESAYERLTAVHGAPLTAGPGIPAESEPRKPGFFEGIFGSTGSATSLPKAAPRGRQPDSLVNAMAKSAVRSIGSTVGRELIRGVLGSLLGGGSRRR
jgi:hypothetical protein